IFSEPVQTIVATPMGDAVKIVGRGLLSGKVVDVILTPAQLGLVSSSPDVEPFDGDPQHFRLAIEAMRLALAFEYDPFFSLSIARVDPLPHQLEAVYDYFLKLPRIRFLLADDPGAGKTIMAGLLLKELKARGLVRRTLVVAPANLTFQWQRELKDKFRENFEVIRGETLRNTYGQNPWQDRDQVVTSISWVSRIEDAKESLLRRTKEALVSFPDPETGEVKKLFTKREVKTSTFELNEEEFDFYDALTTFVEEQSIRASADDSAAGRAVGFIMAMLQRRMASSVYAVRRSLERMKERREEILKDPDAYRRKRIEGRIPDDFDELPEDEQN